MSLYENIGPITPNIPFKALQIGDKYRVTTPVNWRKGDDVIVHPSVTTEEAKTLFPEHTVHKVVSRSDFSPRLAKPSFV